MRFGFFDYDDTFSTSRAPPSALSSHTILAVLQPDDDDEHVRPDETLFAKMGVLRGVALCGEGFDLASWDIWLH